MKCSEFKLVVLVLGLSFTSVVNSADIDKLAKSCEQCHGKDGASISPNIPTIAGQPAKFLMSALKAFKDKERVCPEVNLHGDAKGGGADMCKVTLPLSEEEITALANFYSGKKFVRASQDSNAALAAKGKELHGKSCEKCHADGGGRSVDNSGILAGQQMGYLNIAIRDMISEKRAMNTKMQPAIEGLSKENIEALVNYYGSFK